MAEGDRLTWFVWQATKGFRTHKHVLDGCVKRGSDVVCLGHCHSMISTFGRQYWVISTFSGLTRLFSVSTVSNKRMIQYST